MYDFLILINSNLGFISHRSPYHLALYFGVTSFEFMEQL